MVFLVTASRRVSVCRGALWTGAALAAFVFGALPLGVPSARAVQWAELFVRVEPPVQETVLHVRPVASEGLPLPNPTRLEGGVWQVRLAPGRYRVEVLYLDQIVHVREVLVRPGERMTLVVSLPRSRIPEAAATVEVRVPRGSEPVQSPSTAYAVTSRQMEDVAVTRRWRLQDLLAETSPGVVRSHDDIAHVRGAETAVGYNINGTTLLWTMNPLFGLGPDPAVFRWIQLRTGGYSAEYGWRFMGLMDAVPQSGLGVRGTTGRVEVGAGSPGIRFGRVAIGTGRSRWGLYADLSGLQSDAYFQPRALQTTHDRGRVLRLFVRGDYRWDDRWLSALTLMAHGGHLQIPVDPTAPERLDPVTRLSEFSGLFETDYLGSRWQVTVRVGWFGQTQRLEASHVRDSTSLGHRVDARRRDGVGHLDLTAGYTWRSEWTLRGGVQVRRVVWDESIQFPGTSYDMPMAVGPFATSVLPGASMRGLHAGPHEPTPGLLPTWGARDDGWLVGLFIEQHGTPTPWLRGNVGLRWDRLEGPYSAGYVSPRLNVTLGPRTGPYSFLFSYNRLVWSPPVENYLLSSVTPDSRPLRPTVADAWEAGVRLLWGPWTVQTSGFYRYGRDVYHTVNALSFAGLSLEWFPFVNFRAERVRGLETQVRWEDPSGALAFILNYTLAWHDFYGPVTGGFGAQVESGTFETGRFPAPMDQRHTVTGLITVRPRAWLRAALSGTWASGLPVHAHGEGVGPAAPQDGMGSPPESTRMPAYLYLNGQVVLRLQTRPTVEMTLNVENLTDRRAPVTAATVFQPAQYLPGRKVVFGARGVW